MKKTLIYLAAAVIAIPALNSCKKGEEDPLSFNSRDSRITGTWTLSTWEEVTDTTIATKVTNDVNDDEYVKDETIAYSDKVSGGTRTITWAYDYTSTNKYKQYSGSGFNSEEIDTEGEEDMSVTYKYTVTVSIYKDNTYTATYTQDAMKYETSEYKKVEGITTVDNQYKGEEESGTTRTWTEEGTWSWADAKKDKVIINAGPLSGYLLKLAKDEVMISESESESDNDVDVDEENDISTYSNSNPSDTRDGLETTSVMTKTTRSYSATWTKTDKESERAE